MRVEPYCEVLVQSYYFVATFYFLPICFPSNISPLLYFLARLPVETILLKLSHHADRMSTLRGKRTLNRARRGPDLSSAAQRVPANLQHLPSHVTFDLRLEVPTVRTRGHWCALALFPSYSLIAFFFVACILVKHAT